MADVYSSKQSSELFAFARSSEGIHWTQPFRLHFKYSDNNSILTEVNKINGYFIGFMLSADGCHVYADAEYTTKVAGLFVFDSPESNMPKVICFKAADRNINTIYLRYKYYTGSVKVGKQILEPAEKITEDLNEVMGRDNYSISSIHNTLIGFDNMLYTYTPFTQSDTLTSETIYISVNPPQTGNTWAIGDIVKELNNSSIRGLFSLSYCDLSTARLARSTDSLSAINPPLTIDDIDVIGNVTIYDKSQLSFLGSDITYNPGAAPHNLATHDGYLYFISIKQYSGMSNIVFQDYEKIDDINTLVTIDNKPYGNSAVIGTDNKILSYNSVAVGYDNKSSNVQNNIIGTKNDVDGILNNVTGTNNLLRGCFNKVNGENNKIYGSNTVVNGDSNMVEFIMLSQNNSHAAIHGKFDKSRLNWNVNDEEPHQDGTLIASYKEERCEITNGVIKFSVDPRTVLHCQLTDFSTGSPVTLNTYYIYVFDVITNVNINVIINYNPNGTVIAYSNVDGEKGPVLNGLYLVKYWYSSSIVLSEVMTNVIGSNNSIYNPMDGATFPRLTDKAYTNVMGNKNITSHYSNNIFGNSNTLGTIIRNVNINNNSIVGNYNNMSDHIGDAFTGSFINGNNNDLAGNVVTTGNFNFDIEGLHIYGSSNDFKNSKPYTINEFVCIGAANTFGTDVSYTLQHCLLAGHKNDLIFTEDAFIKKMTILGHYNKIKGADNVDVILGSNNNISNELDINFDLTFPESTEVNTTIIGKYNEMKDSKYNSTICGNDNKLIGSYSSINGQSNWVDGDSNYIFGQGNKVMGFDNSICGLRNDVNLLTESVISGMYNNFGSCGKIIANGHNNAAYYSESINFTGFNNTIISSNYTSCAGIDNIIYTLLPNGINDVTEIELVLNQGPTHANGIDFTISHITTLNNVIKGVFTKGKQLGIYPLSYCNLAVGCEIYYSIATDVLDRVFLTDIQLTDESTTELTITALAPGHNANYRYYLRAFQYKGITTLNNVFDNINVTLTQTPDGTTALLPVALTNADLMSFTPILHIFDITAKLFYRSTITGLTNESISFIVPTEFAYVPENDYDCKLTYKLVSALQNIYPYKNSIVNGTSNVAFAKNNIICGSDNFSSYANNSIVGINNIVSGANVNIGGMNNGITGVNVQVTGNNNTMNLCNTSILGNGNFIFGSDLMSRYEDDIHAFKTANIKTSGARLAIPLNLHTFMDNIGGILNVDSTSIQKANTMLKFCKEMCIVANSNITFSKPYKQVCNTIIKEVQTNIYIDCTIKVLDVEGILPKFWLTDGGIKTNLANGTYSVEYYYLPFYNIDSGAKIIGNDNILTHKFLISDSAYTSIMGDYNKTTPGNIIHGARNNCQTPSNTILGNSNSIICAEYTNEGNIPDNLIVGSSFDVQIIGNYNEANIKYIETDGVEFSPSNNNIRNFVNIIGMMNKINILGSGIKNYYTNIIGSSNNLDLVTPNTIVTDINILGNGNNITPISRNCYAVNVHGNYNRIMINDAELRNALIFGHTNTLSTPSIPNAVCSGILICGDNNNISASTSNIICLSTSQIITNCNNIAVIGQTNIAKTDINNTIIVPGILNCGAEVINLKYMDYDSGNIVPGSDTFYELNRTINLADRLTYLNITLPAPVPPNNKTKIILNLPEAAINGTVLEIILEINNIDQLEHIELKNADTPTMKFKRPSGRIFTETTASVIITNVQFVNYKIKCTKLSNASWLIEN